MSSSQCLRSAASRSLHRASTRCPASLSAARRTSTSYLRLSRTLSTSPVARTSALLAGSVSKPLLLRVPLISTQQTRSYADKTVQVPQMAESITEGTLKQFSKQVGDYVELDEEIATIETDKIDVSVNAPQAGTIKEFLAKEDDTVTVGQDLLIIDTDGKSSGDSEAKSEPKEAASDKQETSSQPDGGKEKEAPKDDKPVKDESSSKQTEPAPQPKADQPTKPPQDKKPQQQEKKPSPSKQEGKSGQQDQGPFGGSRQENRVKMNRMRLRIAERLKQSQNTAASLTTFNEVDMSSLMEFRKLYKDEILKKTGVKLGFMSAFSRACVLAMKELPAVNASIEGPGSGDTIVYRDYVDISVAVATEKGLVTPVVRNADGMDLIQIEQEIAALGKKARDNKLTIEDMAGGTFTISNGGVFGSLMGTPIINLPQTAVLGLHAIKDKPVAINGKVEIRPMMYLALTYDHRLLDGREAVTFLVKVKELIEDPRKMLLGI